MAQITKRGIGQYQVRIRRQGYPVQTKTFRSQYDAQTWAATIESEMLRGTFVSRTESEKTSLFDALARYRQEISIHKKDPGEPRLIMRLQKSPMAKKSLANITTEDFAKFRDIRLQQVSARSVQIELSLFSHLFNVAAKEWGMGYLVNPVKNVRKPKVQNARDRRLKIGEEKRLLKACGKISPTLKDVVIFAIETASRRSEIARLNWTDVDLTRRSIKHRNTKNGDTRVVPLSLCATAVITHQNMQNMQTNTDSQKVFDITPDRITHQFAKACKQAKITELRFHDLRHEATSRLFEKGLSVMEVATITGHKSLAMLNRYTHLCAHDLLDKLN